MEISSETKEKFSKGAETIYKMGFTDGKSSKKNQSDVEKELGRFADAIAKRVTAQKNIPDSKRIRGACSGILTESELTRDKLLKTAGDFITLASTMPKPAPKVKTPPTSA